VTRRALPLRRGAVLAEWLVALVITTVVAALAAATMLAAERRMRGAQSGSEAGRIEQDVELVLRSELRSALGDSIIARGDTALELLAHVGSSALCTWSGRVATLPPSQSASGVALSRWRYTPASGDLLYLYDTASVGWRRFAIDSAASRVDASSCPPGTGFQSRADSVARRPIMRLYLSAPIDSSAFAGVPVRIVRRGRWGLVRGTDRSWELAYRSCDLPGHCGASQPVAGPLAPPADSGLLFRLVAPGRVEFRVRAVGRDGVRRPGIAGTITALTVATP
jgi:hypothetical protein